MQTFKKGDTVTWNVGGRGGGGTVTGQIVSVVGPGGVAGGFENRNVRTHKSFVVKGENGKLYWPVVSSLSKKE